MVTGPAGIAGLKPSNTKHADFDLWIRMATDNKINSSNSWKFALIDYFHDLSLLRDGDGINFQKASATLDGCVKIYSSRVDSAATETGKLLSGLATKTRGSSANDDEAEGENEGEDENGQNNAVKQRRRTNMSENTLVKSFDVLKAKKVDMELSVDPLFKKALADFDEGGAKSLLLNILSVDESGRVLFDTTSDSTNKAFSTEDDEEEIKDKSVISAEDVSNMNKEKEDSMEVDEEDKNEPVELDILDLQRQFFPDLTELEELTICPSMRNLELVIENGANPSVLLEEFDKIEDIHQPDEENIDYDLGDNFDHDFSNNAASIFFDDDDEPNVNDTTSHNTTLQRLFDEEMHGGGANVVSNENISEVPDFDLLSYFDSSLKKNWANGPEHWKIQNLKRNSKFNASNEASALSSQMKPKVKEKKNQFMINFMSEEEDEDEEKLFSEGKTTTLLPKAQWISDNKHVLPDDKQFSTKRLIHLFIKPTSMIITTFNKKRTSDKNQPDLLADENFWASKYKEQNLNKSDENMANKSRVDILREDLNEIHQSYDQSFFQDDFPQDDFDNGNFDDNEGDKIVDEYEIPPSQLGYGSQLVTGKNSFRPSLLNFSRVAKKVDVKLLKDNLWDCLQDEKIFKVEEEKNERPQETGVVEISKEQTNNEDEGEGEVVDLKFSSVVNNLGTKYTIEEKNDLSTSFCFICLLHLANENGFSIQSNDDNSDLIIKNE